MFKRIALHLGLMAVVVSAVLLLFFHYLLPALTHHGQFITVPNLKGISLEEVDVRLTQRHLRFEVTETFAYSPDYPPLAVLQQHPKAGAHVKESRKIYLTLNSENPPTVSMPNLVDGSVRNAHVHLKSHGLLVGAISYVPDFAQNAVLEQWHQGTQLAAGAPIAQGARVDLVVGAGLGSKMVEVPDVTGMQLEEAKLLLLSAGIAVGNTAYASADDGAPGTVLQQRPDAGKKVRIGENMDLWLAAPQEEAEEEQEATTPDTPMLPVVP